MKPICIPCRRFYRVKQNGYHFIEGMPIGANVQPGLIEPEKWTPYKIWVGDLWRCEGCGHETISGVAHFPWAEHYQADFAKVLEETGAKRRQINDC